MILVVSQYFRPEPNIAISDIAETLAKSGEEVVVLTADSPSKRQSHNLAPSCLSMPKQIKIRPICLIFFFLLVGFFLFTIRGQILHSRLRISNPIHFSS